MVKVDTLRLRRVPGDNPRRKRTLGERVRQGGRCICVFFISQSDGAAGHTWLVSS